jgi:2,3-bisphosphoglycerate-dependent phosphoglycerate mutase
MDQRLFLIRHCAATGQAPDAPLTSDGVQQAEALAERLAGAGIVRIVSSPYQRARDSAAPLAARLNLPVETDARLAERVLCPEPLADWRAAMVRGVAAVGDALHSTMGPVALVTHGNLLTLLLRHFDGRSGFDVWEQLRNPAVFVVHRIGGEYVVEGY